MVFRQVTDRAAGFGFARVSVEQGGCAGSGMDRRGEDFDEGGFPGSIGSEQAVFEAARDAQTEIGEGSDFAISADSGRIDFSEANCFNGVVGHRCLLQDTNRRECKFRVR